MTKYAAVDFRALTRNAASQYCQRIFGTKLIGMYTVLTVIPKLVWWIIIKLLINRAKTGGHFIDVKQSSFRHLLIW